MSENLLLIENARIWTPGQQEFDWMTIDSNIGYVQNIGNGDPNKHAAVANATKIDMGGRRILPGLHDSHLHVSMLGELLSNLNLVDCRSMEDFLSATQTYAKQHENKAYIYGRGWDDNLLGRLPTKEDIDSVCNDKPVLLTRVCGHGGVANSKALALAGVTSENNDADFDRYPANHPKAGELTGIVREDGVGKVRRHFKKSRDDIEECINAGVCECLKRGLTGVHSNEPSGTWTVYKDLACAGKLPIRVFYAGYFHERDITNFPKACERHGDMLYSDRVKLFVDGALGVQTAALSVPYKNKNGRGQLMHGKDKLFQLMEAATTQGFRLELHVIGDDGAEAALDGLAYAKVTPEKRPILTHCQVLRADLLSRMKTQGVIANIQPPFVPSDGSWVGKILPDELMPYAYAWRTLIEAGVHCASGSDAPVESCDPLVGIYDSIFRRTRVSPTEDSFTFRPEECLTVNQAIELYTTSGAWTAMEEDRLGQLLPGYYADFIVINSKLDVCDYPEEFSRATVAETWIAGRQVYKQNLDS